MSGSRRAEVLWDPDRGASLTLASSEVVIGTPLVGGGREPDAASPRGRVTAEELYAGAQAACFALAFGAAMQAVGHPTPAFRVEAASSAEPDVPALPPASVHVVLELGETDEPAENGVIDEAVAAARAACDLRDGDRVLVRQGEQEREVRSAMATRANDAHG